MTPDIRKDVHEELYWIWKRAFALWTFLSGLPVGTTSHAVNRAISARIPHTIVRDGYFGTTSCTHSWIMATKYPLWVIDCYPVAQLPGEPVLVSIDPLSPWAALYRAADIRLMRRLVEDGALLRGFTEATTALDRVLRRKEQ